MVNDPKPLGDFSDFCLDYVKDFARRDVSIDVSTIMAVRTTLDLVPFK